MLQLFCKVISFFGEIVLWLKKNFWLSGWIAVIPVIILIITYLYKLVKQRTLVFSPPKIIINKHNKGQLCIYNANNSVKLIKIIQVPSKIYNKYIVFNKRELGTNSITHSVYKQKNLTFDSYFLKEFLSCQSELEQEDYNNYKYTDIYIRDGYYTIYKLRNNYNSDNNNPQWTYKKLTSYSIFLYYFIQFFSWLKRLFHNKILFKLCWNRYCKKQSLIALNEFIYKFQELISYYKSHKDSDYLNNEWSYSSWNRLFNIKFDSKIKQVELAFDQLKKCFDSISDNKLRNLVLKKINKIYNNAQLPQIYFKKDSTLTLQKIDVFNIFKKYVLSFIFENFIDMFIRLTKPLLNNIENKSSSIMNLSIMINPLNVIKNLENIKKYIFKLLSPSNDISFKSKHDAYKKIYELYIKYNCLSSINITKGIKQSLDYIMNYLKMNWNS